MKPREIVVNSMTLRSSLLKYVFIGKRRKRLIHQCHYGTSSKSGVSNISAKLSNFNLKNFTVNFMPILWKSVTIASSLFGSPKTVDPDKSIKNKNTLNFSDEKIANSDQKILLDSTKIDNQEDTSKEVSAAVVRVNNLNTPHNFNKNLEANSDAEQSFFEWLTGGDMQTKRKEFLGKDEKHRDKVKKIQISKSSLQQRSRFLVSSLCDATSSASQLLRLEEVCKHLILYPDQKSIMCKAGLLRIALRLRYNDKDEAVQTQARCVLALIGFPEPPRGNGIRILSLDGGGTRGILTIEILRQLEARTNKKVYQLFDMFCGVSSGAILAVLLGGLRLSLDECEFLYRKLSDEVFCQSTFWGTSRLMWSHAYYDTTVWVEILKKTFGEDLLIDTVKKLNTPKIAVVSAIMNLPHLEPFVFRNYDFPPGVQSYYKGSCKYRMWESIRGSGAAPGYFEEYCLDDYLHQDGGIMINNPTALAIHEARMLWPSELIQCVMSVGTGRYIPATNNYMKSTSLKTKVLKVIDSATDTEAVHIALNDLLSPYIYFRMNPYLTEFLTLDENRPEKLDQMKRDAQMYVRRNEYKFINAAETLTTPRSYYKSFKDWLYVRKKLYL